MKDLEKKYCIEKIPRESGLYNKWKIGKLKNLQNIREHYPGIRLNKYGKSLHIILKELYSNTDSIGAKKSFVQLVLSASFFDKCLEIDFETLYARASEIYSPLEDLNKKLESENMIHEVHIKCMNGISKISDIWLVGDNEPRNGYLNLDVYQNFPKCLSGDEISEETFEKILKEIKYQPEEKDRIKQTKRIIKELALKMSCEILSNMLKKIPEESLETLGITSNEISKKILNKMSAKIFIKIMEGLPEILPDKIYDIIYNQYLRKVLLFDRIFEHCYERDVIDGKAYLAEKEFFNTMTKFTYLYMEDQETAFDGLMNLYNDYYEQIPKKSRNSI